MAKQILYHEEARRAIKAGIDKSAAAVRVTIGPRGRNVALQKYGSPQIINDGVSIAKDISFSDPFENMGAELVKEVADKTNASAGDGTTSTIVLFHALVEEGMKRTSMGANAMLVRSGIEKASADAQELLKGMAKQLKGDTAMIQQVATISAESEELGTIIAETIKKVGKDGVVTVEESQSMELGSEVVEGLEFDKGYISPYMISNPERMEAEAKDVAILVTDQKIAAVKDILPLLEELARSGTKDLVIIAEDIEGEALATFVVNKLRGGFNVIGIKAPGYGDRKKAMLQDIATVVGATVVTEEVGMKLEKATSGVLGKAGRVVATKDKTTIIGGKAKKSDIEARVAQLKAQIENTDSKYDREKLEERIAKLSGGVAVIQVGAATETEMKYLKLKIEDAVNATKAALDEGVVAGGGTSLVQVAKKLKDNFDGKGMSDDEKVGYHIMIQALNAPFKQIVLNTGVDEFGGLLEKVRAGKGYNALTGEVVDDMIKAGILDPLKVERLAIQNAASAAAILLTTDVAIADEPKKEESVPQGGAGGYGDMM